MDKYITSSAKDDWETPKGLFDKLNKKYNFTLDAAASDTNHKCKKYFTKEQDGLKQDWKGHRVFCNPPYGGKSTREWMIKCATEAKKLNTIVVALLPARTDTIAFHEHIYNKAKIEFLKGRLKFEVDGVAHKDPAPFPSMIVYFE